MMFRAAGVIGWPVAHSRSPLLHGYWLERYRVRGTYVPLPVRPADLSDALRGLRALGFAGCNVTIPHKEAAARLVDRLDPTSARTGAVNLIVVEQDGTLVGRNTDGDGFLENLRSQSPGWRGDAGPVVVLGAGGGARSVMVSLLQHGAPEIRLLNRTHARAEELAEWLGDPRVVALDWADRDAALADAALLVNATSLGMTGQDPLALDLAALPRSAVVCDLVYNPLETSLLATAQDRGHATVDGLGMLLHQARPAFAAWFGVLPDITDELRAIVAAGL
ncbi:MAG: shikimate dehydrogenase [Acidisphaera sp.]|nr:shikimate dehydrogenase [Acidisphaera sp.]